MRILERARSSVSAEGGIITAEGIPVAITGRHVDSDGHLDPINELPSQDGYDIDTNIIPSEQSISATYTSNGNSLTAGYGNQGGYLSAISSIDDNNHISVRLSTSDAGLVEINNDNITVWAWGRYRGNDFEGGLGVIYTPFNNQSSSLNLWGRYDDGVPPGNIPQTPDQGHGGFSIGLTGRLDFQEKYH